MGAKRRFRAGIRVVKGDSFHSSTKENAFPLLLIPAGGTNSDQGSSSAFRLSVAQQAQRRAGHRDFAFPAAAQQDFEGTLEGTQLAQPQFYFVQALFDEALDVLAAFGTQIGFEQFLNLSQFEPGPLSLLDKCQDPQGVFGVIPVIRSGLPTRLRQDALAFVVADGLRVDSSPLCQLSNSHT